MATIDKKVFYLVGLPEDLHKDIKIQAKKENRSMNSFIVNILMLAITEKKEEEIRIINGN